MPKACAGVIAACGEFLCRVDGEFLIGVSDLFNQTETSVAGVSNFFYRHETPGRTFFGRLMLSF